MALPYRSDPAPIEQIAGSLGANGLPYALPLHPNLVHFTIGLFVIAIAFDVAGALYPFERRLFRFLALPVTRAGLHDVGWYNLLVCAVLSFFTVATGFYELLLAQPIAGVTSAIGLDAITTMLWHGVGGVVLLLLIVALTIWRGFQRFLARQADHRRQARREPRSVSYASFGNGHPSHVAVESFARAAGIEMLHVPFKDSGTQLAAVANGEVDFTTLAMFTVMPLIKAGRLRPLAVAARRRLAEYPDLPTVAEAGGPMVEMRPWAGLVARAGTPAPLLEQIHRDVLTALMEDGVRSRIEGAGFQLAPSTPQQMHDLIVADSAEYAVLVREGRVQKA